ncbi:xanthotoxin 5-hydroxylase CYP82C2-like [Magnolia sinica]|uniref:xanthotoxin 5-hydroxylase CYP82C2-like n=1 Tax=Magnolia sinica TaxID=86752 RepID=UPI0026582135|nr:xanthotoxin 5-hydroxylase CYP82C2-like [Magnolia sinica]
MQLNAMETSYLTTALTIIIFFFFFFLYQHWKKKKSDNGRKEAPEPGHGWPIIGHLALLAGEIPTHQVLGALADQYGPAITLRLGRRRTLLVSSWELAKECFTTNDRSFAGRPKVLAGKYIGFNHATFALAPYSSYWRETRKIAVLELLSTRRLESLQDVWPTEVDMFIRELYDLWASNVNGSTVTVEMKERLWGLSFNVITRMVSGKRYFGSGGDDEEARQFRRVASQVVYLLGVPDIGDALPFLRWFDFQGYEKALKKIAYEMDSITERWMNEHRRKMGPSENNDRDQDFFDVLLSLGEEGKLPDHHPTDTFIKSLTFTMITAGSDTTSIELVWALSLLMNHRDALKRAQDELDMHIGRERLVQRSDIEKLTYLQAIIKETLRLYPAGPLLIPHEAIEACQVGGFHVRAGTRLLVNVWKIHRDPRVWSDPLEFRPERFLGSHVDVDVWGQNFELIPFGSGRRSCVGISLALQVMQLALARLLHGFDWATPMDGPVDMTEGFAFSLPKKDPLLLLIKPRLPLKLYE